MDRRSVGPAGKRESSVRRWWVQRGTYGHKRHPSDELRALHLHSLSRESLERQTPQTMVGGVCLFSYSAECVEGVSLLKNPSTPLPSTLQGLKNPAIAVFWRGFLSVW